MLANSERAVSGPDTTTYHFDAMGALRWVARSDGTRVDYVIDAVGRRIGKKVNGVLVQGFLYQSDLRIAAELTSTGAVLSRFVYGTQPNVPEYMERNGTRFRLIAITWGQCGSLLMHPPERCSNGSTTTSMGACS